MHTCPHATTGFNLFSSDAEKRRASDTSFRCHHERSIVNSAYALEFGGTALESGELGERDDERGRISALTCRVALYDTTATTGLVFNRCVPTGAVAAGDAVLEAALETLRNTDFGIYMQQLDAVVPLGVAVLVMAVIFSYIVLFGIRALAKFFTWLLLIIFQLLLIGLTVFFSLDYARRSKLAAELGQVTQLT